MHDYTVKDSSLWINNEVASSVSKTDTRIRIGIVQEESYNALKDETIYMVNVLDANGQHMIPCTRMVRFGSPYNYEEHTRQTYEFEDGHVDNKHEMRFLSGESVVIAMLNGGQSSGLTANGIILGSINHPYRNETLRRNNEVAYISEFNGIETYISKIGEWRQTFRGIQTNVNVLREAPNGEQIPEPEYDKEVGGGFVEWDDTGSWYVTDNTIDELPQSIHINKKDGLIEIISGKTILTIDKNTESYSVKNKAFNIESEDSFSIKTKATSIESTDTFDLVSKKINTTGEVAQKGDVHIEGNTSIKGNIEVTGDTKQAGNVEQSGDSKVDGNFETTGQTKLAGGAKPLITDIIVIKGTGNLGAPVMSAATILTTTMTKAT